MAKNPKQVILAIVVTCGMLAGLVAFPILQKTDATWVSEQRAVATGPVTAAQLDAPKNATCSVRNVPLGGFTSVTMSWQDSGITGVDYEVGIINNGVLQPVTEVAPTRQDNSWSITYQKGLLDGILGGILGGTTHIYAQPAFKQWRGKVVVTKLTIPLLGGLLGNGTCSIVAEGL